MYRKFGVWIVMPLNTATEFGLALLSCSCTSCVRKITGIFEFFLKKKKRLFAYVSVLCFEIVPVRYNALVPALHPIPETFFKPVLGKRRGFF